MMLLDLAIWLMTGPQHTVVFAAAVVVGLLPMGVAYLLQD